MFNTATKLRSPEGNVKMQIVPVSEHVVVQIENDSEVTLIKLKKKKLKNLFELIVPILKINYAYVVGRWY